MAGGFHSMNRSNRRVNRAAFSDINVTPLVDVMLVLLLIFMLTAPMLTVGVPVDLPKTHAAKLNDQIEPLVVTVNASGQVFLQETEIPMETLVPRLMAITQNNPEAKIYVRGDKNLAYGRVMETMGEISAAGFSKVSLLAEMPPRPSSAPMIMPQSAKGAPIKGNNVPQQLPQSQPVAQQPQVQQRQPSHMPQQPASSQPMNPAGQSRSNGTQGVRPIAHNTAQNGMPSQPQKTSR